MEKASSGYINTLRDRKRKSHVYVKYQSAGLALGEILHDRMHKALYMRLAKTYNPEMLIAIAKDIATRANVGNRGAYFMKLLKEKEILKRNTKVKKKKLKKQLKVQRSLL